MFTICICPCELVVKESPLPPGQMRYRSLPITPSVLDQ
jgi:hypothetical protein